MIPSCKSCLPSRTHGHARAPPPTPSTTRILVRFWMCLQSLAPPARSPRRPGSWVLLLAEAHFGLSRLTWVDVRCDNRDIFTRNERGFRLQRIYLERYRLTESSRRRRRSARPASGPPIITPSRVGSPDSDKPFADTPARISTQRSCRPTVGPRYRSLRGQRIKPFAFRLFRRQEVPSLKRPIPKKYPTQFLPSRPLALRSRTRRCNISCHSSGDSHRARQLG